jgi:hypothetical protein
MAVTDLRSAADYSPAPSDLALFGAKGLVYTATLSGTLTLDNTYPSILKLDPGGSGKTVVLDTEATHEGLYRRIINAADAAENLTVTETSGDGGSTIATINQNEQGEFYCDGASWTLICITTIALS